MDHLEDLLAAANAPLTDPERNLTVGDAPARYELYHFAMSLCSQKVRLTLIEMGVPFAAHDLNLSLPELGNYDPHYVRLRMQSAEGRPLVKDYTGRSSTTTEGFDPAVVPTLVDREQRRVVSDSLQICAYLDEQAGTPLTPDAARDAVAAELKVVDGTPHVALFYGAHPAIDVRPERLRRNMTGVHDRKISKIRTARAQVAHDPDLVAAFDAKIAKEEAAREFVATPPRMRAALNETLRTLADLEAKLADGRRWVCGDAFTLGDVFWSVSLYRLAWLGMAFAWTGRHTLNASERPHVHAYTKRAFVRPAFRSAVVEWPFTPPSEHIVTSAP